MTAPSPEQYRTRLNLIEANCTKVYFHNYITLFPEGFATNARHKHGAQDAFNNILNLCYEFLKAQCFQACYKTHFDPFLGFLHSTRHGKPAMVCDLQEFFRVEVDSFLYERQDRLALDTVASDNGRVFLDRESVLRLMLELKDFSNESRGTRVPFGTSHKYSRQTIVKFQARQIVSYITENKRLIHL